MVIWRSVHTPYKRYTDSRLDLDNWVISKLLGEPENSLKGPVTLATNSGDIARRLVAGDKFIAETSLSDFFVAFTRR